MSYFKLILVDTNRQVTDAFHHFFSNYTPNYPMIEAVYCSRFEEINGWDAIVSPANSFGIMDGGIDKAIIEFFGESLMQKVQEFIISYFSGEQPVGTAMVVPTYNDKHPYLVHSPTMTVPKSIVNTTNVYYAMWAVLNAVKTHNRLSELPGAPIKKIERLLVPGLGTLTGRMSGFEAAFQMKEAIDNFINQPKIIDEINWNFAHTKHKQVNGLLMR